MTVQTSKTLLILWDIDHTLMETGGVGGEIHAAVFEKVTGHALKQMADVSDRIEPVIFRETLALPGLDDPATCSASSPASRGVGFAEAAASGGERSKFHISIYKAARFVARANISEEGRKVL